MKRVFAVSIALLFGGPAACSTTNQKSADGKAVPTWNYAVVHVYGQPKVIEEHGWLLEHVTQRTGVHEAGQALPWEVSDAPRDFTEQMISRIVGIEIPISKMQGKWKVSQNRKVPDRIGVAAGLESQATDQSLAITALVMQRARSAS